MIDREAPLKAWTADAEKRLLHLAEAPEAIVDVPAARKQDVFDVLKALGDARNEVKRLSALLESRDKGLEEAARAFITDHKERQAFNPGFNDEVDDIRARVKIGHEHFMVETDGSMFYLRHERWSLMGAGSSLLEAEQDLKNEASELVDVLGEISPASLSADAVDLYRFVLSIA